MKRNKKLKQNKSKSYSFIGCITRGVILGILSFLLFLMICSSLIINLIIDNNYFFVMVLLASSLSVIIASIATSVLIQKNKLISGVLAVIIITIIQFVVLLCFNNANLSAKIYIMFPINFIVGLIGSIIGANKRI